ncbi:MAG: hypothetical protein U0169_02525 [Polyangiaceae bacterium]
MHKFEKHDYRALAAKYGSPFYLYDMEEAALHVERLKKGLPEGVNLLYCMKANANRKVLEAFRGKVWGIDISSGGELELALEAGHDAGKMSFAGPGKTDAELKRSIETGVHLVSVESPSELRRLHAFAKVAKKKVSIAIRINPLSTAKAFAMRMGGLPSQFGIAEEDVEPVMKEALSYREHLTLEGIHVFSGTNCLEVDAIVDNIRQTLGIAKRLSETFDHPFSIVNLGGGFGIPYFPGQESMDTSVLSDSVGRALREFRAMEPRFAKTEFILELGRYMIGMFGIYVASVVDVKETRGKRFAVLDGGMNHCFPPTGNFGQLVKKNYPLKNLSRLGDTALVAQEIVGPLCTPMDSLGRALELPKCEPGDLVGFLNSGAYSYSASPLLFLGHHTPVELVYDGKEYAIGRSRHAAGEFS